MIRFLGKSLLFLALNGVGGLTVLALVDARYDYEQWETRSRLSIMPRNTEVDVVILGSSRAQVLSNYEARHKRLQKGFGANRHQHLRGYGSGIVPNAALLQHFYDRNNRAGTVIFCVDPYMFSSPVWNEDHVIVYMEPFRVRFALRLFENGVGVGRLSLYLQSKFTKKWFTRGPQGFPEPEYVRPKITEERVKKRVDYLYQGGFSEERFRRYGKKLEEFIAWTKQYKTRLIFVQLPTLLGEEPAASHLNALLTRLRDEYPIEVYDLNDAFADIECFADHDHLSSEGIARFAQDYLRPILDGKAGSGIDSAEARQTCRFGWPDPRVRRLRSAAAPSNTSNARTSHFGNASR